MRKSVIQTERHDRLLLVLNSIFACVGAVFICVSLFSAVISRIDVSESVVALMSTISLCAGCFAAAYTASKKRRRNGIATGLACGVTVFIAVFTLGLIFARGFEAGNFFTKTIIIMVCSVIGGIAGVNSKARIR